MPQVKLRKAARLIAVLTAFALILIVSQGAMAAPVKLTVENPTGSLEVSQLFAPRVADLNGKTICEVMNGMWESKRTFPVFTELLQNKFPKSKIVPSTQFRAFDEKDSVDEIRQLAQQVKAAGCQVAIVGNAG
jgi:hypothetical protein